jgi:preprotein translocase subunit SecF
MVLASVVSLAFFGLNFGIDFKGGSLMEIEFSGNRPAVEKINEKLSVLGLGEVVIQEIGDKGLVLRFKDIDETLHQNILNSLKEYGDFEELRFDSVGPLLGEETKQKSLWAIVLVVILILTYIAWAFRKVSFPLKSWKYGVAAIIALFHDVLIASGSISLLGHFVDIEIGAPFVAALLTILGYSVNDTIVIFDRIRENILRQGATFDFEKIINKSVSETYVRSLNTSLTVLFALVAILIFGGETIHYFALTLIIGIAVGTYSSIFLASPLLFSWSMIKLRKHT